MRRRMGEFLLGGWLGVSGCAVSETYHEADDRTYRAIAPEYLRYVERDPLLDPEQKASRRDTCASWRARVDQARGGGP